MNMERAEELCLNYLRQSKNPLVPVGVLAEYCTREGGEDGISVGELLPFLRRHGEVQVMEGPAKDEVIGPELFTAAGLDMGPRAILNTRIPAPSDMGAMLSAQAKAMTDVLRPAIAVAEKENAHERAEALRSALAKAEAMRARIAAALPATEHESEA